MLDLQKYEEQDIKALLGIPQPKLRMREVNSLGGGGNINIRKEINLGRLEDNRIPPAIRLKQIKNRQHFNNQIDKDRDHHSFSIVGSPNTSLTVDDSSSISINQGGNRKVNNQQWYGGSIDLEGPDSLLNQINTSQSIQTNIRPSGVN